MNDLIDKYANAMIQSYSKTSMMSYLYILICKYVLYFNICFDYSSNKHLKYFMNLIKFLNSDQHTLSRMLISNMSPMYDDHIFVTCLSSFSSLINLFAFFDKKQIYWRDIWCIYYSSINMQSIFQSAVDLWLRKKECHMMQKL